MLALLASTVSACTCSHHEAEPVTEVSSCLYHSEMAEMVDGDEAAVQAANICQALDDDCVCIASEQKTAAKFEAVKYKKQPTIVTLKTSITVASVLVVSALNVGFANPHYLLDPFCDHSRSRGPPRL